MRQRQQHAAEECRRRGARFVFLRGCALARAPQQLEQRALGKLRRAAQAAMRHVDRARDAVRRTVELREPDDDLARRPRLLGQPRHQRIAVFADAVRLLAEQPRELAQHVGERGAAVARLLRKIRAAPHRLARGREKHRERPAALLAEEMQRVHVDLVDVGPLLAVDLDVDEQLVHHARRRLVLEALVRHHVAPVTSRVADREQDRPVGALRLGKRIRSPWPPVDRIVLVLQQIRRGLAGEAIGVCGVWCGHDGP